MTETRFTWRWLFVIAAGGVVVGLGIGLLVGWVILPVTGAAATVSALNANSQNDYIVLIANSFALDQDLPRAQERLALLQDANIDKRVETLAKTLAARQEPHAANVADLAVALGSQDSALQVLAASVGDNPYRISDAPAGAPTKYAMTAATPKSTVSNTPTAAPYPTLAPAPATPTPLPKATAASKPRPTAPSGPLPEFKPSFPDQWWSSVKFVPARVASGQKYYHLKSALYCDVQDQRNNCPNLPGGAADHSIYITVVDDVGRCVRASVKLVSNTGQTTILTAAQAKPVAAEWNSTACGYNVEKQMNGEAHTVAVEGLPSDTLTNLCQCNQTPANGQTVPQGQANVRYFLVFELTTR